MPQISFIILTYNSQKYVDTILGSIFSLCGGKFKSGKYEIVIQDNASTDGTKKTIEKYIEKYPFIKFINSDENAGYAKGINKASSVATGKILLVINPDAQLLEEDFEKLIEEFDRNPRLAIAGLKIVSNDKRPERTAGKFFNPLTFLLFSLGLENMFGLRFSPDKKQKVDFVSGGFVAFDSEKFSHLKGYDEDYFMYIEDMDICKRAQKEKMDVFFLPYGLIRHQGQGSSSRTFAIVNIYKGLQIFYSKHHSFIELIFVKYLLKLKAIAAIIAGKIFGKTSLVDTYKEALKAIK